MKLLLLLTSLLFLTNCASIRLPDVCPKIELPGSGDGYEKCTMSQKSKRFPKSEWSVMRKSLICLSSKDWAKIKIEFLRSCSIAQCKDQATKIDSLFNVIDKKLR